MKKQYTLTVSYKITYSIVSYELTSIKLQFVGLEGLHYAMDTCYSIIKDTFKTLDTTIYSVKVDTTIIFGQYSRY